MRIGVIGDIHGNFFALEAITTDAASQGLDGWISVGDLAFKGPMPEEVLASLMSLGPVAMVMGNTDEWLVRGFPTSFNPGPDKLARFNKYREWALERLTQRGIGLLSGQKASHEMQLGGQKVLFVHSTPRSMADWIPSSSPDQDMAPMLAGHDAGVVVCGHIHTPYLRRVEGRTIINTGSAGNPFDGDPRASYLVLEFGGEADSGPDGPDGPDAGLGFAASIRRVSYDVDRTVVAARERGFPWVEEYAEVLRRGRGF
ncbi:MAG: metallophosphoesterase family protein [Firmicutes bacterium]|nr:metallophosphoesterase family protein [Bacillota bacterium]